MSENILELYTPAVDQALKDWLLTPTWDAEHFADETRFFHFVEALVQSGKFWDSIGADLMEAVQYYHPEIQLASVKDRVYELASEASTVQKYFLAIRR